MCCLGVACVRVFSLIRVPLQALTSSCRKGGRCTLLGAAEGSCVYDPCHHDPQASTRQRSHFSRPSLYDFYLYSLARPLQRYVSLHTYFPSSSLLPLLSFPHPLSPSFFLSLSPPWSMQLVQHVVSKPILRDKVELFQAGSLVLPAASLRMAAQLRTLGIFSDKASEVAELAARP